MAITYGEVTGRVTQPGTDVGIRCKITAYPETTNRALRFPDDGILTWGGQPIETDDDGNIPAGSLTIPIVADVVWRFDIEAIDKVPGVHRKWIAARSEITGDVTFAELVNVELTAVTTELVQTISESAAAAQLAAQVWQASTAVTTGSVRQAPDGSRIKSTATRTTRATFDATEQTFWTAVLATTGTIEKAALSASIDDALAVPSEPLVGSQAIVDSLASAALTGHTVGTPVTGLSEPDTAAAVTAFNTLSGGSYVAADLVRTEPLYGSPRKDPVYRITGPFKYKDDSTSQHVGTWAASRTDALPGGGSTGNQGQASWTLPAGSRYFLMRFRAVGSGSTVMKVRFWASKDGGALKPFRALSSQDGNEQITLSADGLYALLPVDLGATGTWTITADFATGTFGGLYTLASKPPTTPTIRASRALIIGDSFATPGQGQFATSLGYVMRVVRELGLEAHVSAQGGTGVVARNGAFGVGTSYNYLERVEQAGGDVDGYFDDNDQPAYIAVQLSQNDRTYGWSGSAEFDTNFAALCRNLRGRFPNVPFDVYGIMHTRSETFNSEYFALEDAAIAFLEANPDLRIGYVPGLLRAGIATGTGYMGATNGTGTSDTATWTDSSHPSPINGTEPTGHGQIATQVLDTITARRAQILQPDGGYKRPLALTSTIGTAYANQAAAGDHAHTDAVAISRLPTVWTPYRLIRDFGTLDLTGLLTGTSYIFAPGVGCVTAATAGSAAGLFQIDDDQQAISGLTTKMRLAVNGYCNATAPGCTFTIEMVLAGALSGAGDPSVAIGAALSPAYTATITTPSANSKPATSSGQVTAPATNTYYLIKITTSADMAAGSHMRLRVWLEANNA